MFHMGDDDRKYWDEGGMKVYHGQMSVKGATLRFRGKPLTAARP